MRGLLWLMLLAPPTAGAVDVAPLLAAHELVTLDGEDAVLGPLRGETVVVNFWAEWCAPCRRELPVLDAWHREFVGLDVLFVPISIDRDRRKAQRWAERLGLELPLFHDGPDGLASTLDLPALPITYVIDPRGRTVFTSTGSDAAALAELEQAIVAAATSEEARR